MKKSIFNLAAAALFLAGTLSCTKEEPETIPTDGELIDLEIVGTHEQFTPQTRTQIGNDIVSWSADDRISVWTPGMDQPSQFSLESSSGVSARFEGEVPAESSSLQAFYPAEWSPVFTETVLSFNLPEEVPARVGGLEDDTNPSFAYGSAEEMTFRNLCGLLRFGVSGSQELRSVIFKAIGGEALCGPAEVSISGEEPELTMIGNDNTRKMTVETLLTEEAQTFYLPLPPGEYSGFEITLSDATGDEYTFTYDEAATVIERGVVTDFPIEIEYLDLLDRRADPLDAGGTANCYMVTAPGTYYFDCTVKGSTTEPVGEAAKAHIVWSEKEGQISDLSVEDGKLIFTVNGSEAGNTVVAVSDAEGTVLWSWHIWCTGGETPVDKTLINDTGKTIQVMDRNLGAWSVTGWQATLYQWGRKDPFTNAEDVFVDGESTDIYRGWYSYIGYEEAGVDNAEVIAYTVAHPDAYVEGSDIGWLPVKDHTLWGDPDGWNEMYAYDMSSFSGPKTEYDPCPAGYRVPNVWTFTGFTVDGESAGRDFSKIHLIDETWNGGWWFKCTPDDTEGIFFPGTGYWISGKNKVWDPEGTSIYREKLTKYTYCWLACAPFNADGDAGALRIYYETAINKDAAPQYTQDEDSAMAMRCVRDDYNY